MHKKISTFFKHSFSTLHSPLHKADPLLFSLINKEQALQQNTLSLIPFENYTSKSVKQALGSIMNSKYSEGLPNARYYGGNQYIDQMEILCQNRALTTFGLDSKQWAVNVQCLSGSPANFYVYCGLLQNHERIMSLAQQQGGHCSMGYVEGRNRVSAVAKYFEVLNYGLDSNHLIDYDALEKQALSYLPKAIVAGANVYCRTIDYQRIKKICDSINAYLLVDISDIAGLLAAKIYQSNPFQYADVVTTCTHKSLRGPRGALVFYNLKDKNMKNKIENAIFPGNQGGPHNHSITSMGVCLKEAQSEEFKQYAKQVVLNARKLAFCLNKLGYDIQTGGTDNHLVSLDVKNKGVDGQMLEFLFEKCNINVTRCVIEKEQSSVFHLGTLAVSSRGCEEGDMEYIGQLFDKGCGILKGYKGQLEGLEKYLEGNELFLNLKRETLEFTNKFQLNNF